MTECHDGQVPKYTVRHVRLSGDYETGTGCYYGGGFQRVYRAVCRECGDYLIEFRAPDRPTAIARAAKCAEKAKLLNTGMHLVPDSWY
jgi:hypothetical protein